MRVPLASADRYSEQAAFLVRAIEIAEPIVRASKTLPPKAIEAMLQYGAMEKESLIHPEPRFRTLASLRQSESDFLTYWNEASGPDVEEFWIKVAASGLPFKRKDVLAIVLKRGKIRGQIEFDIVTDSIVAAEQTGRISAEEAHRLGQYLAAYESRHSK